LLPGIAVDVDHDVGRRIALHPPVLDVDAPRIDCLLRCDLAERGTAIVIPVLIPSHKPLGTDQPGTSPSPAMSEMRILALAAE
jgi:hypothetical protein